MYSSSHVGLQDLTSMKPLQHLKSYHQTYQPRFLSCRRCRPGRPCKLCYVLTFHRPPEFEYSLDQEGERDGQRKSFYDDAWEPLEDPPDWRVTRGNRHSGSLESPSTIVPEVWDGLDWLQDKSFIQNLDAFQLDSSSMLGKIISFH